MCDWSTFCNPVGLTKKRKVKQKEELPSSRASPHQLFFFSMAEYEYQLAEQAESPKSKKAKSLWKDVQVRGM